MHKLKVPVELIGKILKDGIDHGTTGNGNSDGSNDINLTDTDLGALDEAQDSKRQALLVESAPNTSSSSTGEKKDVHILS